MDFMGIDAVEYGAPDVKAAGKLFADWGLNRTSSTRAGMVFETRIGSQVLVRPEAPTRLRPALEGGSQFERRKPNNYRVNRFSEWHLVDGIQQRDDGKIRPSLAAVKAMKGAAPAT